MIKDPYRVLGISPDATPEEIKRAYRRKAKEVHPDLHPDDPEATRKMNEVNEAYDMLQNPDKYRAKREQEARGYEQQSNYSQYRGYQYYGNRTGDFSDFDFGDFFGYTAERHSAIPQPQSGDSQEIIRAIRAVQNRQYAEAISVLSQITVNDRNDRWYYISAYAYNGLGNIAQATESIRKAIRLNPGDGTYRQFYREISHGARNTPGSYNTGRTATLRSFIIRIIMGIIGFRLFSVILQFLFYGLGS